MKIVTVALLAGAAFIAYETVLKPKVPVSRAYPIGGTGGGGGWSGALSSLFSGASNAFVAYEKSNPVAAPTPVNSSSDPNGYAWFASNTTSY